MTVPGNRLFKEIFFTPFCCIFITDKPKTIIMLPQLQRSFVILIISALCLFSLSAQNIPNASFDSVYVGGIDRVYQWVTSDAVYFSNDTVVPFTPCTYYPSLSGNHHFLIKTVQLNYYDTIPGHYLNSLIIQNFPELKYPDGRQFNSFIVNGNHFYSDAMGFMDHSLGGTPFPYRPIHICGSYKFSDSLAPGGDFGRVEALLKKWNPVTRSVDTIALATSTTQLYPTTTWTPFCIPFVYKVWTTYPDSIVVFISASTFSKAPTTLYIDDIWLNFDVQVPDLGQVNNGFEIHPNPCSNAIHITPAPAGELPYRLYNLMGTMLKEGVISSGSLDVSSLSPGSYILHFIETDQRFILKFTKL